LNDDIWIIDVNEKGVDSEGFEKTLKNKNATRLVPVHKTLIDLGFIEFWKHVSDNNCVRLFPELTKTEKVGKFGKQPGKQFSDVINSALSKDNCSYEHKSFHSLRHTFDNFFKQNHLIDDVFLQLFGHDNPGLAKKRYGSEFPPEKLNQLIQKIDYGMDFSHLRNSRYVHPEIKK
jgi:integrase